MYIESSMETEIGTTSMSSSEFEIRGHLFGLFSHEFSGNVCNIILCNIQACRSLVNKMIRNQPHASVSHADCLESFSDFMNCARQAIKQREFEQKFSLT